MFQALAPFKFRIAAFFVLLFLHSIVPAADAAPTVLPSDVTKALDKSAADIGAIQAKADDETAKVRRTLIGTLTKAQEKATKAGNLDLALVLKAKIDEQTKLIPETALLVAGQPTLPSVRARLTGTFEFAFPGGHRGQLTVKKNTATIDGFQGDLNGKDPNVVTILWNNGTSWEITDADGALSAKGSGGTCKLVPVGTAGK